jgi:hypothetical protein
MVVLVDIRKEPILFEILTRFSFNKILKYFDNFILFFLPMAKNNF